MTSACMAISLASVAQSGNVTMKGNEAAYKSDSLRMDSIIHSLPEVMVKGHKPIVKVNGAALVYDLPQLVKEHPADNAYDAIKLLPGVSEENETLKLNAQDVTLIIDDKATTMSSEQVYALLKSMPTSRIANAEVLYSAPARYQVKGQVINIQLKHNTGVTGLQGELFGGIVNQDRTKYTERASLLYTNKKWEVGFLYSLSHGLNSKYYVSAPVNVGRWWKNRLTLIGVYEGDKNSRFYDIPFNRGKWFCQATWNGTFIFSKHWLLNLDAFVHSPEIQGVIDIPTSGYLNAAMTWKPLKGDMLTVKAYCNDIFKTADNYLHDTYKGQYVINDLHKGRTFGVSLTYRFGGYKTKKHEDVDTSRFGK